MTKQLKASESKLSALHGAVAEVLNEQLSYKDPVITYDEDGNEVEGEERYTASPATIAASIKFLKDNNITCDVETNENMNNLRDKLKERQQHSRLKNAKSAALSVVGE